MFLDELDRHDRYHALDRNSGRGARSERMMLAETEPERAAKEMKRRQSRIGALQDSRAQREGRNYFRNRQG